MDVIYNNKTEKNVVLEVDVSPQDDKMDSDCS